MNSNMTANLQTKITVMEAAKLMNVSERSIYMASKVLRSGRQDLIDALEKGELSINKAVSMLENRPKLTKYDRLVKAWNICSEEEKSRFLVAVNGILS